LQEPLPEPVAPTGTPANDMAASQVPASVPNTVAPPAAPRARHRSSAAPLTLVYVALIVYASLYPFADWRVGSAPLFGFVTLGWPRFWTWFDLVANLLGYMPLGALLLGALVRSGWRLGPSLAMTLLAGALLSLSMEMLQNFLPKRIPSNVDWALNSAGTALGAIVGAAVHLTGWVDRWQSLRDRWFISRSAGGLALLLLWPVGLLFPPPVPLGLGQILGKLQEWVGAAVLDTPIEPWLEDWLDPNRQAMLNTLSPSGEALTTMLGLLAPCLLAFSVSRRGWRRLLLMSGAVLLGLAATTISTALNFGPDHAGAWLTPQALVALVAGLAIALPCALLPKRGAAALGLIVLTALVVLVTQTSADPYYADSLQSWEQGRFIRFHGVAQWVGWLWPYAALVYLLTRVTARDGA
jgi:VanZ family protein